MNRRLFLAFALVAGCTGGEKLPADDSFGELAGLDDKSDKFTGRMTIVGDIQYGQTKGPFNHAASKWSALKFAGAAGDSIVVDVKSSNGDTVAWVLDNDFNILGYNDDFGRGTNSHLEITLPANASKTHYIVTRDYYKKAMKFTVTLQGKPAAAFDGPCQVDADCARVRPDCCQLQDWIAVRADQVEAYRDSLACPVDLICPRIAVRENNAMAECIQNKCVAVLPENIACGGHSLDPHQCPSDYVCEGKQMAWDAPGSCTRQCGGIRGLACEGDQICVDNPNDSCDPNGGGADCMGVCRDAICSGATSRCAAGFYWDQYECNCIERGTCGGFGGLPCAAGKECVDDPNDSCDPNNGGADCGGICVTPTADCRSTGCGTGRWCSYCWGSFQCIPDGALC
jgi:hypothetical protein